MPAWPLFLAVSHTEAFVVPQIAAYLQMLFRMDPTRASGVNRKWPLGDGSTSSRARRPSDRLNGQGASRRPRSCGTGGNGGLTPGGNLALHRHQTWGDFRIFGRSSSHRMGAA